jgi:hypothetical protein
MKRIAVLWLLVFSSSAYAATRTATSASYVDVNCAVNGIGCVHGEGWVTTAPDGSTVFVPAGTVHWSTTLIVSKNISILGAGKAATNIINDSPGSQVFNLSVENNSSLMRLSGMTITPNSVVASSNNWGVITISGQSPVS